MSLILVALVVAGVLFLDSGIYSVDATKWHPAIEGEFFDKVMVQSVRHHARYVQVPAGTNLRDRVLAEKNGGAYGKASQTCNGGPGIKPDHWVYL